jgi:hypothetical protein
MQATSNVAVRDSRVILASRKAVLPFLAVLLLSLPSLFAQGTTSKPNGANLPEVNKALEKPSATKPEKPNKPDLTGRTAHSDYPPEVQKVLDNIRDSRAKFIKEQNDLRQKLKGASQDERDQIRLEMRDKRDAFLEEEKDMREELLRRVSDLKDQLKNHQDLIDSSKGQGKGKPKKSGG